MNDNNTFWLNKINIGTGNLKKFMEEYDMINAGDYQFATASQLFPIMDEGSSTGKYEWAIYYKLSPTALKMNLGKKVGLL